MEFIKVLQKNIPYLVIKLQCWFIESPIISLLSIFHMDKKRFQLESFEKYKFKNFNSKKKFVQQRCLKKINCVRSNKKLSLQRMLQNCGLSENEMGKLKINVKSYSSSLIKLLLKKILIKIIQQNYKAQSLKRVQVNKKNKLEGKLLNIFTLRDRILQKIL